LRETVRTWRLLRDLRKGQGDPDALLRDAVRHAYERVPLYRRHWGAAGMDDFARIPPLGHEMAREALKSGELLADGVDADRLPSFPTSGSTGPPLRVPRGPAEQRAWRAAGLRIWLEHGYRWRDVTAHLDPDPGPPHPLQRLGVSRTRWISTRIPCREQAELLAGACPNAVVGTPTVLRRIASEIEGGAVRPRIVFCAGEVLDAASSALIRRAFGVAPAGLYGLTEAGLVAWQCRRRAGYHADPRLCLVEVVRDGRPARPGETGSVLVTSLRARTAPLIRYETGDLAVAAGERCVCGQPLALRSIEGRARDLITAADGRCLTTRAVTDHMAPLLPPDRYRLSQEGAGRFRVNVDPPVPPETAAHLGRLLGDVELELVEGVPPARAADKARPVVSDVRVASRA
jgi:phenylacetate-CoA ligase